MTSKHYLPLVFVAACVSNGTYNKKVADLTKKQQDEAAAAASREKDLGDKLNDANGKLDKANADGASLQKQLDDTTQVVATLKAKLEQLGQNVDALTKDKAQLNQSVVDANARLEELKKQKAAAEAARGDVPQARREAARDGRLRPASRSRSATAGW